MNTLRKPVSELPSQCAEIVMEMNHVIEKFELSRKDRHAFLACSQAFDKKLLQISRIRIRINTVEAKGASIEDQVFMIDVPVSDAEGIGLRSDVIEGCALLANTLDQIRDRLDGVEEQLAEIREELRAKVQ